VDAHARVESEERRRVVSAALLALSEKERTALLMQQEGFSHREIADVVGTTTGSVGTLLARALDKLAAALPLDSDQL
jgi:RNA polymerase sigma factor (sigma-70 family)